MQYHSRMFYTVRALLCCGLEQGDCVYILRDDVIKLKHFQHYWHSVRGIHRSPLTHKGQWRRALLFSLICRKIVWVDNRDAGDLRRHRAHYDVTVMSCLVSWHYGCPSVNEITLGAGLLRTCKVEIYVNHQGFANPVCYWVALCLWPIGSQLWKFLLTNVDFNLNIWGNPSLWRICVKHHINPQELVR